MLTGAIGRASRRRPVPSPKTHRRPRPRLPSTRSPRSRRRGGTSLPRGACPVTTTEGLLGIDRVTASHHRGPPSTNPGVRGRGGRVGPGDIDSPRFRTQVMAVPVGRTPGTARSLETTAVHLLAEHSAVITRHAMVTRGRYPARNAARRLTSGSRTRHDEGVVEQLAGTPGRCVRALRAPCTRRRGRPDVPYPRGRLRTPRRLPALARRRRRACGSRAATAGTPRTRRPVPRAPRG